MKLHGKMQHEGTPVEAPVYIEQHTFTQICANCGKPYNSLGKESIHCHDCLWILYPESHGRYDAEKGWI